MNFLLHSTAAHICLGVGLAGLSGFRAFLPLALLSLFARLELLGAPSLAGQSLELLSASWLIGLFFILALVEVGLDKLSRPLPGLSAAANVVRIPAGALVFAAALAQHGLAFLVAGAVAGAVIAFIAETARGALQPRKSPSDHPSTSLFISLYEDLAILAASVAVLALPWLGILIVAFLLYTVYRARRQRRRKYRGLRILKD